MTTTPTPDLSQLGEVAAVIVVIVSGLFTYLTARARTAPRRTRQLSARARRAENLLEVAMGYIHRLRLAYRQKTGQAPPALPRELRMDDEIEDGETVDDHA